MEYVPIKKDHSGELQNLANLDIFRTQSRRSCNLEPPLHRTSNEGCLSSIAPKLDVTSNYLELYAERTDDTNKDLAHRLLSAR